MDGWMDRQMDGWMDGWVDGWMHGWMGGWMDGRNDGRIERWTAHADCVDGSAMCQGAAYSILRRRRACVIRPVPMQLSGH